jgi:hypothetical protein
MSLRPAFKVEKRASIKLDERQPSIQYAAGMRPSRLGQERAVGLPIGTYILREHRPVFRLPRLVFRHATYKDSGRDARLSPQKLLSESVSAQSTKPNEYVIIYLPEFTEESCNYISNSYLEGRKAFLLNLTGRNQRPHDSPTRENELSGVGLICKHVSPQIRPTDISIQPNSSGDIVDQSTFTDFDQIWMRKSTFEVQYVLASTYLDKKKGTLLSVDQMDVFKESNNNYRIVKASDIIVNRNGISASGAENGDEGTKLRNKRIFYSIPMGNFLMGTLPYVASMVKLTADDIEAGLRGELRDIAVTLSLDDRELESGPTAEPVVGLMEYMNQAYRAETATS